MRSSTKGSVAFSARIPRETVNWLNRSAKQRGMSRNRLIEDLLAFCRDMERLGWHLHQVAPEVRLSEEVAHDGTRLTVAVDPQTGEPQILREFPRNGSN